MNSKCCYLHSIKKDIHIKEIYINRYEPNGRANNICVFIRKEDISFLTGNSINSSYFITTPTQWTRSEAKEATMSMTASIDNFFFSFRCLLLKGLSVGNPMNIIYRFLHYRFKITLKLSSMENRVHGPSTLLFWRRTFC